MPAIKQEEQYRLAILSSRQQLSLSRQLALSLLASLSSKAIMYQQALSSLFRQPFMTSVQQTNNQRQTEISVTYQGLIAAVIKAK